MGPVLFREDLVWIFFLLHLTCFISLAASSSVVMPLRSSLIFMARAFRRRSLTGLLAT